MINGEYKNTFKTKESDDDLLGNCICLVNDRKYLISSNKYKGCSIFNYGRIVSKEIKNIADNDNKGISMIKVNKQQNIFENSYYDYYYYAWC